MPDRQTPQVHTPQFIKVSTLRLLKMTLIFFMFTLKTLFSNLAFQDVNFGQSSSTDSAIITRSSPYNNSHGQTFINFSEIASKPWWREVDWGRSPDSLQHALSLKKFSMLALLLTFQYIAWTSWIIRSSTLSFLISHYSHWRGTLPKAFSSLTSASYWFLFFAKNFSCNCLVMNMACVVPHPGMNSSCISLIPFDFLICISATGSDIFITCFENLKPL